MEKYLLILVVVIASCKSDNPTYNRMQYVRVVVDKFPINEFMRKITGYDSIQISPKLTDTGIVLEPNFCYPNEWEFEKFKKDTVYIHDTIYKGKDTNIRDNDGVITINL